MRIANTTISDNIVRQIQKLTSQQASLQTQVSTGQRIAQPEDDPAAVGRVLSLESEQRQLAQYSHNADRALELSQASFSGLTNLKKLSDRATEIGTLGASAQSSDALNAYAQEVNQLLEQGLQLANSRLRNDYLFGGTATDATPFTATRDSSGNITAVTYAGNSQQSSIPLSETASVTPGTSGATNSGLGDFLNHLVALRDSLTSGGGAATTAVQSDLLSTEDLLVSSLAEHGAIQTRIELNQSQQKDRAASLESLVSADADADLPSTIVKLNQTQTAYQAALQSAASIMRLSLLDYLK